MKDILIEKGVLEVVEGSKPNDIKDADWKMMQNKAASTIHQCLSNDVRYHMFGIDDLAEMWKTLAKCYKGKMTMNKVLMKQKLFDLQMTKGKVFTIECGIFQRVLGKSCLHGSLLDQ